METNENENMSKMFGIHQKQFYMESLQLMSLPLYTRKILNKQPILTRKKARKGRIKPKYSRIKEIKIRKEINKMERKNNRKDQ